MYTIDGKKLASIREEKLKERIKRLKICPKVVSILVGNDPASVMYTNMKQKKAKDVGIDFKPLRLPAQTTPKRVVTEIERLNKDEDIDGIMIQLPLPEKYFSKNLTPKIIQKIDPQKDIDGLTGKGKFIQATVKAVVTILSSEKELGKNKRTVVVGGVRGMVGVGLVNELKRLGEEVEGISKSDPQLKNKTKKADILISATGVKNIITAELVKKGTVVIDVSYDVDFKDVSKFASKITPVPGGVGPMTVVCLMENIWEKYL
ncbi:bifunctional 5,10-methylenetetrahydrofolate dehydrogenase/5,10-methenyltetrahydrofolate cyclohydrolase [Candidatus Daviesbacteria bacterium]|nr:bifunctional 5,10-methylenetetrahydrofolate dehydrogenase/5,10-methenyltetrahydrofolate cyclohydrolase [Candidatus Daviesbacteria bacterium]